MPMVILRGRKDGRTMSRLILEGSSSNQTRSGILNGEPFEVTDEEFDSLGHKYILELASNDGKPDDNDPTPEPEPEVVEGDDDDNADDER